MRPNAVCPRCRLPVVLVTDHDTDEEFMVLPRPDPDGRAWVVRHRHGEVRMWRSPDPEDVPARVATRYIIHQCDLPSFL